MGKVRRGNLRAVTGLDEGEHGPSATGVTACPGGGDKCSSPASLSSRREFACKLTRQEQRLLQMEHDELHQTTVPSSQPKKHRLLSSITQPPCPSKNKDLLVLGDPHPGIPAFRNGRTNYKVMLAAGS
eukprot:1861029-Pyramimonas_sp.AAC.2